MYTLPDEYPTEAFAAFDYLKTKSVLSNDDLKVIALVESIGELFYQVLARGIDNAEARALLERNAAEERGHAHRMLKALRLRGAPEFELPPIESNPFYAFAPTEVPVSEELFGLLEAGELDGDLNYQRWADAEANAEVATLLRLNGEEETRHCERVQQVKALLQAA
jgi:rubrerythrin